LATALLILPSPAPSTPDVNALISLPTILRIYKVTISHGDAGFSNNDRGLQRTTSRAKRLISMVCGAVTFRAAAICSTRLRNNRIIRSITLGESPPPLAIAGLPAN